MFEPEGEGFSQANLDTSYLPKGLRGSTLVAYFPLLDVSLVVSLEELNSFRLDCIDYVLDQ